MKLKLVLAATLLLGYLSQAQNQRKKNVVFSKTELKSKRIDESQILEFKEVKNPPLAPGCKSEWNLEKKRKCTSKYIQKHFARNFNLSLVSEAGLSRNIKVNIEFVIDTNGKPINTTANGGPEILNKNAIEVIESLPDFRPGTKNGKPVMVLYKLPIIVHVVD